MPIPLYPQELPLPEATAAPLQPNRVDIDRHLFALFSPTFVNPYPDAWIEIAYASPAIGGRPHKSRHFSAFDLAAAAAFAEAKNKAGFNIYVGVALRRGKTPSKSNGRASGTNVVSASYAWAEFDNPGDGERIDAILKEKNLPTAMTIVTGRKPHLRAHLYFKITDGASPAELKNANEALKALFGSDDVKNPDRLMRIAGTINYPTPKKAERGYMAELVTLDIRKNAVTYTVAQLTSLVGHASNAVGFGATSGRNDDELRTMLEASREPSKWHNCILGAVATMVGRGWSDLQIRLACAPYCKDGADDTDLDDLIDGARKKWNKRDPEIRVSIDAEGGERSANEAPVAQTLPTIKLHPRISVLATETQQMLMDANVPFYQRGGELVRPIIRTVKAAHGQPTETAQLKPINSVYMRDTMCRHAHWLRFNTKTSEWVQAKAPMDVAGTLLARDGIWKFKEILGVIACPTMRPDGSLLVKQGYDPATRLLLVEPPPMPAIPDHPTREDALKALALLEDLLCESPFVNEASKSVALSGLITPVVRGAMPVVPMHASSAPAAGTGKSFLWDMVAAISIGQRRIPVIAAGDEEETEKRLGGILLTGQPLISIDNVNRELKGEFLAQAIEQQFLDLRPLGASKIVRVEAGSTTIFCTGNNILIAGADLWRRTIIARLDAEIEKPQLRQFKYNPIKSILDDRGKYIAACLTICRAYDVAGCPEMLPRLASFEAWSDMVRSALVWLGKADPVETMEDIRSDDPERELLGEVLQGWAKHQGVGPGSDVLLNVIVETATKMRSDGGYDPTPVPLYPEFNAAVRRAAGASGNATVEVPRFGIYCRTNKGRIVDGLRLMNKPSNRGGAATWWVERR
jgi:hypothetical protein